MTEPLGRVVKTDGTTALCRLDRTRLLNSRDAASGTDLAASSVGGLVKIAVGDRLLIAIVCELEQAADDPGTVIAEVEYLGEGGTTADGELADFRRGVDVFPMPGDPVRLASDADYRAIYAPPDQPHIMLGMVHPTVDTRAPILFENLLGRHFAIVGSTGTGKSTLVSLLLGRILERAGHAHIVVLDPHGEYAHAFGDQAQVWNVDNFRLPYWALNLAEHCEAFATGAETDAVVMRNIMANCLQRARARNVRLSDAAKITADNPVPYQLADLTGAIDEEAGRLEKQADASRFTQLRLAIERRFADPRFDFIFNQDFFTHSLEGFLGDLLRIPGNGKPVSIIDLAGVPTEVVNLIVATLSRLVMDYAIRTPRADRAPMLLVCEEAHRYLPQQPSAATAAVQRQLERIAREGRKYGVCLGIVSQRPSELSSTALSQCGTVLALRLNNVEDQAQLKAGLSEGSRSLVDVIASLRNRECIAAGDGVPTPMRIRIDTILDTQKPDSHDESFADKWQTETATPAILAATVKRWREGI
ncbi:MAG: ATP-binding protein [Novosphingobium sp.]